MRNTLVVSSENDPASVNIRDRMLEVGSFVEVGSFDGHPAFEGHGGIMVTLSGDALYRNNIDAQVLGELDFQPTTVVYLSRHSSASGRKSLTVHPIGNFSHARFGGFFRQLVHPCPGGMTRAMRRLTALAKDAGLPHAVSFEVTHHGPYLNTPTYFIEIGSDEEAWGERRPAEVLARTVLEVDPVGNGPVVLGVGGGHYAPRHTDVALRKAVCYSHIIPNHAVPGLGNHILEEMLDYVCEARMVYYHRKSMPKADLRRMMDFFESHGMRTVRERDLPDLPSQDH